MREQNANLRPRRFSAQRFSRMPSYFQIRQVTNKRPLIPHYALSIPHCRLRRLAHSELTFAYFASTLPPQGGNVEAKYAKSSLDLLTSCEGRKLFYGRWI